MDLYLYNEAPLALDIEVNSRGGVVIPGSLLNKGGKDAA